MEYLQANSADQAYTRANILHQELKHTIYAGGVGDMNMDVKLNEMSQWIDKAYQLHLKEPAGRRQAMKQKIDQLKFDCEELQRTKSERERQQNKMRMATQRRQKLMETKFDAHSGDAYIDILGADLEHHDRMSSASSQVDGIIAHGQAIKEALVNQRTMIKNTKRMMLSIAQTLGLSNTVMRLIEQRTAQDKVILFGGMAVTTFLMWLIYSYIKG